MTGADASPGPDADAIVLGGGLAGLVAAYELAKQGLRPLVVEARSRCGGLVFGHKLGDVWVDLGAESYAKRSRAITTLCAELGLHTLDPAGSSWIYADDRGATPIPHGVLGIPTSLDDPDVALTLSPHGLQRARVDLTLGGDVGADAPDLASLVTARLGVEVLDRLVAPVAGGIHSAPPELLSPDAVTPGLREALRREGSLTAAAAALRASAPPGAVVAAVEGGMFRLVDTLVSRIEALGGTIVTEHLATSLAREGAGWVVGVAARRRPAHPWLPGEPAEAPQPLRTPRLVVALEGRAALDVLRGVPDLRVADWTLPRGADLVQVALAVDDRRLDAAPRGSGCLVVPGSTSVSAKAVTHYSIKWPWTTTVTSDHILRVSYGRAGVPTPEPTPAQALADASTLLGVDLAPRSVKGSMTVHFENSLPPQTPEHRARVAELTAAVATLPGLGVTGAWVAGTGLAAVVPHAAATGLALAVTR